MKIRKIYESNESNTAYKITKSFFEKCDNFETQQLISIIQKNTIEMTFDFYIIDEYAFEQISKCKEYVNYSDFYIKPRIRGDGGSKIVLYIIITLDQQKVLDEKLDLDDTRNKYNI